jgi:hypothetical protein
MPQPYARSSPADRCRAGATGDARGIIPLPAGGVFRVVQYLPPAGREMISLHPQCAGSAGCREMVPARRAVFALPNHLMACRYINRPMSWSIKQRCTEGSLRPNVCRSRMPEAVGLTGAGRAHRGCKGNHSPCPPEAYLGLFNNCLRRAGR